MSICGNHEHMCCSRTTTIKPEINEDACYNPKCRTERQEPDRFKSFTYAELAKRDKANLDSSG